MSLVSVVAVVSESDVGVEGFCMLKEPVDKQWLLSVADDGMDIEGESPVDPSVRKMQSPGFSPTESSSGTCCRFEFL